mmetsp:Transcript_14087/g.30602  ORF Transcript_14087/g.30602 Transcript_14087/m.30602 type:complete len:240 (-) Transcript_14087:69-788(-)|eukprot:CAMPEP_0178470172 /NCGR_PEP_ID=MMETSP0696-20121128/389_1 /TAXON_ID=265572 /ORGANISM="Extubocellulus spinifer, Strain CCMP396" /LENGTH=239 /DNA_ID=CAMNT_0020097265 /DNA_START=52 /DNA_END=767 /DNA_ORIENTATION=+
MAHQGLHRRIAISTQAACNQLGSELRCVIELLHHDLHLLLLLVYGVGALATGLVIAVGLSIVSAICSAATAYLIVTFLVLRIAAHTREARRTAVQVVSLPKICLADITRVMEDIPVERYVTNEDLDNCSVHQLRSMLTMRRPRNGYDEEWSRVVRNPNVSRAELVACIRKFRTTQSDTCCICFEEYKTGDILRVLPKCHHEFHCCCIEEWAKTFVTSNKSRKGCPTCPLCNDSIKLKAV